jgi:DNA invertase Pin-like site-specific DNA recombinase
MNTGKKIGYIRVSTKLQNTDRQLDNIDLDLIFTDTVSGKDTNRPSLKEMLNYIRDGDVVYVHCMDRLARKLNDLKSIIKTINDKKATITFVKEGLTFENKKDSHIASLMLNMMGAFSEFEYGYIKERQLEGVAKAKEKGVYSRYRSLNDQQINEIKNIIKKETKLNPVNKTELAKLYEVSKSTIYNYIKSCKNKNLTPTDI